MTQAPDLIHHLNDVDDVLSTAAQFGDVLFMAANDSAFDHDARNATQSMCDAMREKIATARELLTEMRGREYCEPLRGKADTSATRSVVPDLKQEIFETATKLERLMSLIHGGDWGVNINHNTQFVLVSRIFPSGESAREYPA